MKALKISVRFLDSLTDKMILVFCLLLFLIGLYALYDSYLVYVNANDESILKYKPGYESSVETNKVIKGKMVAWITLDDTTVDHPIMQGKDNAEYLNKDPFGDYSLSGSIFLDSRNSSDFSDYYSLVYGHHMEGGAMFGALDKFLDRDYFNAHKTGSIIVGDLKYNIRIFAAVESEATERALFAPTENDDKTLDFITENALYFDDDFELKQGERLLALSTCKYPDSAERTLIIAVIEKEGTKLDEAADT